MDLCICTGIDLEQVAHRSLGYDSRRDVGEPGGLVVYTIYTVTQPKAMHSPASEVAYVEEGMDKQLGANLLHSIAVTMSYFETGFSVVTGFFLYFLLIFTGRRNIFRNFGKRTRPRVI